MHSGWFHIKILKVLIFSVLCSYVSSSVFCVMQELEDIHMEEKGSVTCIAWCPFYSDNFHLFATGHSDGKVTIWNASGDGDFKIFKEFNCVKNDERGSISSLAWHPGNENLLAVGVNNLSVYEKAGKIAVFGINKEFYCDELLSGFSVKIKHLEWNPKKGTTVLIAGINEWLIFVWDIDRGTKKFLKLDEYTHSYKPLFRGKKTCFTGLCNCLVWDKANGYPKFFVSLYTRNFVFNWWNGSSGLVTTYPKETICRELCYFDDNNFAKNPKNNNLFATVIADGKGKYTVKVFEIDTMEFYNFSKQKDVDLYKFDGSCCVKEICFSTVPVKCLSWNCVNENVLAVVLKNSSTVYIYNVKSGKSIAFKTEQWGDHITCVSWHSEDPRIFSVGHSSGKIALYKLDKKQCKFF